MSKILVDEEVLNFVAVALKRGELVAPNSIDQKRCTDSLRKIENAIQESKQKNFSIIEWHPVSEKPKETTVLIRLRNGKVIAREVFYPEIPSPNSLGWAIFGAEDEIAGWAYLLDNGQTAKVITALNEAQEIIHCSECKFRKDHHYEEPGEPPYIKSNCENRYGLKNGYTVQSFDFCSRAERISEKKREMENEQKDCGRTHG